MAEINPYEPPQTDLRPAKQPAPEVQKAIRPYVIPGIQLAFSAQLLALAAMSISWIASERAHGQTNIYRYAKDAVIAGMIAGILGIGMILAAKTQHKPRWVVLEMWLLGILILCAWVRLI